MKPDTFLVQNVENGRFLKVNYNRTASKFQSIEDANAALRKMKNQKEDDMVYHLDSILVIDNELVIFKKRLEKINIKLQELVVQPYFEVCTQVKKLTHVINSIEDDIKDREYSIKIDWQIYNDAVKNLDANWKIVKLTLQ